ncbi:trafficking protein particle complex subunit 10, partial [Lipomyces oligophaga]|uniref:trafficking protein particle complex subunit 10 n=1 Tax=Lipomyces oligophaga TaxID=45792 RepID=UPI0034CFE509
MATPRSVSIAYYDPFGVAPLIVQDIQSRLPLRNVHWLKSAGEPSRSIPLLSVTLAQDTSKAEQVEPQHQIRGLLDTPYMKIILVKCEDNDTYRSSVRKIIRDWLNTKVLSMRDSLEWLIFFYDQSTSSTSSTTTASLRFKTGLFDKIKADFNTSSKEDRCIQIKTGLDPTEDNKMWAEGMTKIRDGLISAFTLRVQAYDDEVKKLEAKKAVPGWNFATFFVQKEGLALAFENMSLLEDALIQYDELDNTFLQLLQGNTITYFPNVGFEPGTISPLLSRTDDSAVRHQILENHISLFDFRCYLFSRQASLLLLLMSSAPSPSLAALRISQLLIRTRNFALETSRLLITNGKNRFLVANWVYTICQEVIDATQVQPRVIQGARTRDVAEGRAEILLLSRWALEQLAKRKGWHVYTGEELEDVDLSTSSPSETGNDTDDLVDMYLNDKLKESLEAQDSFMKTYMDITTSVLANFELADRTRSVDKLRAQMALIQYSNQNYKEATEYLSSLPQLYSHQGWDTIATNLFVMYSKCLYHINQRENYLKVALQILSNPAKSANEQDLTEICNRSLDICRGLDSEVFVGLESLFPTTVGDRIVLSRDKEDAFYFDVHFFNSFPVSWTFNSVSVRLIAPNGMKHTVLFRTPDLEQTVLEPKQSTKVVLQTLHSVPSLYEVDNIEVKIGMLTLTKDYLSEPKLPNKILRLFQQPGNLDVQLVSPRNIQFEAMKHVIVEIHTGWNDIADMKVMLRSAVNGLKLSLNNVSAMLESAGDSQKNLEIKHPAETPQQLELSDLPQNSVVYITVPYNIDLDNRELMIRILVDFQTTNERIYSFSALRRLSNSLSLLVNVHDIFKTEYLFSKFSISSSHATAPLRVLSADLVETAEYHVQTCQPDSEEGYIAFPKQAVSIVYRIWRSPEYLNLVQLGPPAPLSLSIKYRKLEDEVKYTLIQQVDSVFGAQKRLQKYVTLICEHLQEIAHPDLTVYGFLDKIDLGLYDASQWGQVLSCVDPEDVKLVEDKIAEFHTEIARVSGPSMARHTRCLTIPVDVGTTQVLFRLELIYAPSRKNDVNLPAARLAPASAKAGASMPRFSDRVFHIGEPIPIVVRLSSCRSWQPWMDAKTAAELDGLLEAGKIEFFYEVIASPESWIISGRRKGRFSVPKGEHEQIFDLPLFIIPLKRGHLLLPIIDVRPSESDSEKITAEIEYANSAESIMVLPDSSNVLLAVG